MNNDNKDINEESMEDYDTRNTYPYYCPLYNCPYSPSMMDQYDDESTEDPTELDSAYRHHGKKRRRRRRRRRRSYYPGFGPVIFPIIFPFDFDDWDY